ncbi:MAG: sensor histidine kinase [Opitutaceae bacterium]
MFRSFLCFALLLSFWSLEAADDKRSTFELEVRKKAIVEILESLSRPSLRGGVGSIGFHSSPHAEADHTFWVEIDLGAECVIDEVVLVPVLWRDMEEGFRADAFPAEFRVLAGTAEDREGIVVAEYEAQEGVSPGITPLVLKVRKTTASWVRIEVPRLSQRVFDDRFVFQLSEIFVFSNGRNVALRQSVETSEPPPRDPSGAWSGDFLVDGTTPYIMNSAKGGQSVGFLGDFGVAPVLYLDLGERYTISGINLHAVEQSNTVPQAFYGDLGIPGQFKIEGADTMDFENPIVLLDCSLPNISDVGPIMMWNVPESRCRYLRIVTTRFGESAGGTASRARIGFAEVELFSGGINVAEGKKAWVEPAVRNRRNPLAMTDGQNYYGKILPIQSWLQELGRGFDLELELVEIREALNERYARQKKILRAMSWLLVVALFMIVFVLLYGRMQRVRNEARVRERIAANLHDELGANLHAIGMWSDIAQESVKSPEMLNETLQRIRGLTERAGASARFCANMLEAKGVCEILVDEMKREAARLLADIRYEISFDDEAAINALRRRKRIDTFLFFKESLTNIIRHGQATSARISLSIKKGEVELIIVDDGCGFSGGLPKSLQRRARLMRAKAGVEHLDEGGTLVWLKLKAR